jgi:hypothetical protein
MFRMLFLSHMGVVGQYSESDRWGCAHLFRPTYPDFLHGAPPTSTCPAFIEESRLKFANAGNSTGNPEYALANVGHPSPSYMVPV